MKAYQIKLKYNTRNRLFGEGSSCQPELHLTELHDVIPNVFNFNSGYPHNAYHLLLRPI